MSGPKSATSLCYGRRKVVASGQARGAGSAVSDRQVICQQGFVCTGEVFKARVGSISVHLMSDERSPAVRQGQGFLQRLCASGSTSRWRRSRRSPVERAAALAFALAKAGPSERPARGPRVKTLVPSSWRHLLKIWSLLKIQGGSCPQCALRRVEAGATVTLCPPPWAILTKQSFGLPCRHEEVVTRHRTHRTPGLTTTALHSG